MPIDPDRALAARFDAVPFTWTADDVIRYHLALGAGSPECSGRELGYVYEAVLRTLGTFAAVPASAASAVAVAAPGLDCDSATMIHGEQEVELVSPLPVTAESRNEARVVGVYDKGSAALVEVVVETSSPGGPLARSTFRLMVPGAGGFGGDPGPGVADGTPSGAPDRVVLIATLPQQAALYRMSGDRTPLHIDPEIARAHGFPRPTLPGLCTWGMVAKCLVDHELEGDVQALRAFGARFAGPVYPGETLEVRMWRGDGVHRFDARVLERDAPALSRGTARVG